MSKVEKLGFYATPPHECNYLPDREAITLFADPRFQKNTRIYAALADCGFRRSGEHLYIPHCEQCTACTPVRIPVSEFSPSRSQKRTWKRNRDLMVRQLPAEYNDEYFLLYQRYLNARHRDGGMDNPKPENYLEFLTSSWSDTVFYEMRDASARLVAIAVVDVMDNALSAVYTFYDPDEEKRSLGRYAILYEIEQARLQGMQWLYLGYWIEESRKMSYKTDYQPLQYYVANEWKYEP